ncbi:MAG: bifunctional nicotinamidase/pyrazinamidase [Alphaproteobacteria bacterium]|nr:bifunctional nicotinamidase/pyrazinamidase [Alphaproteobacteria bacterium]MCY4318081.1 bifunctional nicotinamidase/pyrazinamidase [Alphaproteobacteria bacterium]
MEALLVVDVQNDFCTGGALAVPGGEAVVPGINRLWDRYACKVLTQDWHPPGHASFASSHPGKRPFDTVMLDYGEQVLWPDHCVQGRSGAAFHPELRTDGADLMLRKGFRPGIDSYSAFFENDRCTPTGLAGYLRERGVEQVVLTGLATDFCVGFSALDALAAGFSTVVLEDLCRGLDMDGSSARMLGAIRDAGGRIKCGHA